MAFVSVPEERFILDVYKTWLAFFATDSSFSHVSVTPTMPDFDVRAKFPALVLKRVSEENWSLDRLSWFYQNKDINSVETERQTGMVFNTSYQITVLAKSYTEQMQLVSKIMQKLKVPSWDSQIFAESWSVPFTEIPVKDFTTVSPNGTLTDLRIRYRYWRDVSGVELDAFDSEIYQYAITVDFWVPYISGKTIPKVVSSPVPEVEIENW